jgi:hypothetical protein
MSYYRSVETLWLTQSLSRHYYAPVKSFLERLVNIAIVLVCCFLAWTFITQKRLPFGSSLSAIEEARLQGQTLPPLPSYKWGSRSETLVLAIRSGCHFCENSLPFYKHLSELEKSNAFRAHLLAVMPDDKDVASEILQSGGVTVESVFGQPLDSIKVSGTPTLLLLDAYGRVKKSWVGQLQPRQEEEVIAAAER